MYTFVKFKNSNDWFFKPNNINDVYEHFEVFSCAYMNEGVGMLIKRIFNQDEIGHFSNTFAQVVDLYRQLHPCSIFEALTTIKLETLESHIKSFTKYPDSTYYNNNLVVYNTKDEPVEIIHSEKLVFPVKSKPTMEDVKYLKWGEAYNGFHVYAKVNGMDVVDKDGNQKWNSQKEAENAAKWFIENYFN